MLKDEIEKVLEEYFGHYIQEVRKGSPIPIKILLNKKDITQALTRILELVK